MSKKYEFVASLEGLGEWYGRFNISGIATKDATREEEV